MIYDGAHGGVLSIDVIRLNSEKGVSDDMIISFDSTDYHMIHTYTEATHMNLYNKTNRYTGDCAIIISNQAGVSASGTVTLTRYDLNAGIVSGTFSFVITKPGCETRYRYRWTLR